MGDLDLLPGTLDLLVLQALVAGPAHGYDIARQIHSASHGTFTVIDSALYASLHRLERAGQLAARWGRSDTGKRAKYYALTVPGERHYRTQVARWYRYVTGVSRVIAGISRQPRRQTHRPATRGAVNVDL